MQPEQGGGQPSVGEQALGTGLKIGGAVATGAFGLGKAGAGKGLE